LLNIQTNCKIDITKFKLLFVGKVRKGKQKSGNRQHQESHEEKSFKKNVAKNEEHRR